MKNITIAFVAAVALLSFAGCKKKDGGGSDAVAKNIEFKDQMCKCTDKACAEKVQADMAKWTEEMSKSVGKAEAKAPDQATMDKMAKVQAELAECTKKALGAADPAAADPAADPAAADPAADPAAADGTAEPAAAADVPAECTEYKAMIEKLASCDKLDQKSRDALKQTYDATEKTWANAAAMPDEEKAKMGTQCKTAADALEAAAATTCGW